MILVGGHESNHASSLAALSAPIAATLTQRDLDCKVLTAGVGRALHNRVATALGKYQRVVVLPMTFGRNPTMIADAAKTLKWLGRDDPTRLCLAQPFASTDLLAAWLRQAANQVVESHPGAALIIAIPKSNPFDEAEMHRLAYLVGTNSRIDRVEVAVADTQEEMAKYVDELRKLGYTQVAVVPAGFDDCRQLCKHLNVIYVGPLMSQSAIQRIVGERVVEALHALSHGDAGIEAGLEADHGHGYAHSHAFDESQGQSHHHHHHHHHSHH